MMNIETNFFALVSAIQKTGRQDNKPGGSGAAHQQEFQIHGGKQEGSKRNVILHSLNLQQTQRLWPISRVRQKKSDNTLHRLLLDKTSRFASQVFFPPNTFL